MATSSASAGVRPRAEPHGGGTDRTSGFFYEARTSSPGSRSLPDLDESRDCAARRSGQGRRYDYRCASGHWWRCAQIRFRHASRPACTRPSGLNRSLSESAAREAGLLRAGGAPYRVWTHCSSRPPAPGSDGRRRGDLDPSPSADSRSGRVRGRGMRTKRPHSVRCAFRADPQGLDALRRRSLSAIR